MIKIYLHFNGKKYEEVNKKLNSKTKTNNSLPSCVICFQGLLGYMKLALLI